MSSFSYGQRASPFPANGILVTFLAELESVDKTSDKVNGGSN
jgi:hypothetical protein